MNRKPIFLLVTVLALGLILGASAVIAQEEEPETQPQTQAQITETQTVYGVIQSEPRLEAFEALVEAAALDDNLQQDGPFTVFAPTNEAWAAFEAMAMSAETDVTMTDILLYHVLNGEYSAAALANRRALPTLAGEHLFFDARGRVFGAAAAGAEGSPALSEAAVNVANITLNERAKVLRTDIQAANGVVHVIDAVVPLPEEGSLFASQQGSPEATLAQVLANDGRFETFLSLAEQAGLIDLFENTGATYTVFAPTDEAFAAAPQEMMEQWLADPQGELRLILSYHIVGDRLSINQIATDKHIPTVEGRSILVTRDEEGIYLNGRSIQSANILAANGVIHAVDEPILP